MLTLLEQSLTARLHRAVNRSRSMSNSTPELVRTMVTHNIAQIEGERNRVRAVRLAVENFAACLRAVESQAA